MKKINFILVVFCLGMINTATKQFPPNTCGIDGHYNDQAIEMSKCNDLVFALTWLDDFCYSNKCHLQELKVLWDKKSFTIHGLWPAFSPDYKSQIQTLTSEGVSNVQKTVVNVDKFWPSNAKLEQSYGDLWKHEFDKHGIEYMAYYIQKHGQTFPSQLKIQQKYFTDAINLYNTLNVTNIQKFTFNAKDDLAYAINVPDRSLSLKCRGDGSKLRYYVSQVQICYQHISSISSKSYLKFVDCPDITNPMSEKFDSGRYWCNAKTNLILYQSQNQQNNLKRFMK